MKSISDEQGIRLVTEARRIVKEYLTKKRITRDREFDSRFSFHAGVFVTLNKHDSLRGCIGFTSSSRRLCDGLADAAVSAATKDPRFSPVMPDEIDMVRFEVTVLTEPEEIIPDMPNDYISHIIVGKHGLIVKNDCSSGLLLPQVGTEYNWSAEEFLTQTCYKAGLGPNAWKEQDTKVFKFEGIIFKEETPSGRILRDMTGEA